MPVSTPKHVWPHYQKELQQLSGWQVQGLLGIVTPNQELSADALWTQKDNQYSITLSGALGIGTIVLSNQGGNIVLTDAKGKKYRAANAEALMNEQFGWSVPVNGLIYWIRGLPMPDVPFSITLNQYGTLASLKQDGWQVRFSQYHHINNMPLPGRIVMTRPKLRVVMVVNHWQGLTQFPLQ